VSRPQPVLSTATVTALIAAILGLLVAFGVDIGADQRVAILAVIGPAAAIVTGVRSWGKVTPLSDPVSADGTRLVPETTMDRDIPAADGSAVEGDPDPETGR